MTTKTTIDTLTAGVDAEKARQAQTTQPEPPPVPTEFSLGGWSDEPEGNPEFDQSELVAALKGRPQQQRVVPPPETSQAPPPARTLSPAAAALDAIQAPAVGTLEGASEQAAVVLHEVGGTGVCADAGREQQGLVVYVDRVQERLIVTWRAAGDRFGRDAQHRVVDRASAMRWLADTVAGVVRPNQRLFVAVSETACSIDELEDLAVEANAVVVMLVAGEGMPRFTAHGLTPKASVVEAAPAVEEPADVAKPAPKPVPTDQTEWLEAVRERLACDEAAETLESWIGTEVAIHRNQRAPFTGDIYTSLTGTVEVDGRTLELEIEIVPGVTVPLKELRILQ